VARPALCFRGLQDLALHSGEGDFEGLFTVTVTVITTNTISIRHVLVLHHHV
jgi:hypothetical protein